MTATAVEKVESMYEEHAARRQRWMAERKALLTSTDAARILGISPYGGPIDVYLEKSGKQVDKPDEPNNAQRAGRYFERPILMMFADLKGIPIIFGDPYKSVQSPTQPLIAAQIDARRQDDAAMPSIDAKNIRFQTKDWGEEGTDQIPLHIAVQLVIQMHVLETPYADVAALFSGQDIVPYRLHRDLENEQEVVGSMLDFHQRYIVKDVPPPIDGTESYARFLNSKFRKMVEKSVIDATPEHCEWAEQLLQTKERKKLLKTEEDVLKNLFRNAIGESHTIVGPDWRATWSKPGAGGLAVDWQMVAAELRTKLSFVAELLSHPERLAIYLKDEGPTGPACIALAKDVAAWYPLALKQHSTEKQGSRRFTLTSKKGGSDDE